MSRVWALLATLNYHSNDLAGAIEAQKKAHENDPTNVDYMVSLGEFLRQDEKIEEAITILSAATKLNPENANAHNNLGILLQGQGKFERLNQVLNKLSNLILRMPRFITTLVKHCKN